MTHDLNFDTLISRCRVAVEPVAPQLIYTNTTTLDVDGFVSMDFVSVEYSDNHLLSVGFSLRSDLDFPEVVMVNTVDHFHRREKHNRAVKAIQKALEVEFQHKFNVEETSEVSRITGSYLGTPLRVVR